MLIEGCRIWLWCQNFGIGIEKDKVWVRFDMQMARLYVDLDTTPKICYLKKKIKLIIGLYGNRCLWKWLPYCMNLWKLIFWLLEGYRIEFDYDVRLRYWHWKKQCLGLFWYIDGPQKILYII